MRNEIQLSMILLMGALVLCGTAADVQYGIAPEKASIQIGVGPGVLTIPLFTKPQISGSPVLNPRMTDLDWAEVRSNAEDGNPEAAYLLAHKLISSRRPYQEVAYWLGRAAAAGHGPAQNDAGMLAMLGLGVTRDITRAFSLFQSSARNGVAMGHLNTGLCQLTGFGASRSYGGARAHLDTAVRMGLYAAEVTMAFFHAYGTPVAKQDNSKAYELALFARSHSNPTGTGSPNLGSAGVGSSSSDPVSFLEALLGEQLSYRDMKRIQQRVSTSGFVSSPAKKTYVEAMQSAGDSMTRELENRYVVNGVLVIGPAPDVPETP